MEPTQSLTFRGGVNSNQGFNRVTHILEFYMGHVAEVFLGMFSGTASKFTTKTDVAVTRCADPVTG